jgi:molecular chaperone IbpA
MVTKLAMDLFNDPFFIGWDKHLAKMNTTNQTYPPYDIVKLTETEGYYISLAVAGFEKHHLEITVEKNTLIIEGEINGDFWEGKYIHEGIAKRRFERTFSLGEYMEVASSTLENGVLHIEIRRNVPEEAKPKQIKIK